MDGVHVGVQFARFVQFFQDGEDAACAMHVFHVVVVVVWGGFADARYNAAQAVDVGHFEIDAGFVGNGQQVQNGIGRAAHGDVHGHGVFKRFFGGNAARQHGFVVLLVIAFGDFDNHAAGFEEQFFAACVGSQIRTVARQGKAECFGQTVHGVGGKHAGAGAASWAGVLLDFFDLFVADVVISRFDHGVNQVQTAFGLNIGHADNFTGFHRAAGNEDGRNVQAHGGNQHARGDFVAVGNAHQCVGAVGVDHVFDRVGNQVAAGQGVEHTAVTHGDTVVNGDGVEFFGNAAGFFDFTGNQLAHIVQVHMAWDELGEGVGNGDNRFAEVGFHDAGCTPQCARACHIAAVGRGFGAVFRHFCSFVLC